MKRSSRKRFVEFAAFWIAVLAGPAAHADLTIRNVTLYDGTGAPARAGVTVVVQGDRIAEVTTGRARARGRVIDGTGKFLMPGIMDTHIHLPGGQTGSVTDPGGRRLIFDKAVGEKYLQAYLYVGVTSLYDSSNNSDYIFAMREAERRGEILSPRLFAAGGIITVPMGYAAGPASLRVESWEQAQTELGKRLLLKPDMLKFALDRQGILAQPLVAGFDYALFERIVRFAADRGVRSTVHVTAEVDAEAAIKGGAAGLAHPVWRGAASEGVIQLAAAKKTPISTTLVHIGNVARLVDDPSFLDEPLYVATLDHELLEDARIRDRERYQNNGLAIMMRVLLPHALKNAKRLHDGGAILALGTDRSQPPAVHQELEYLAQAGISAFDCIRIATLNGAAYVGREKDFGSVEVGKWADLLLLNADPAADVRNFRAIAAVFKGGQEIDRAKLDVPANARPAAKGSHGAEAAAPPKAGAVFRDCAECPEMVALPAGRYTMGSSDEELRKAGLPEEQGSREKPAHEVRFARPFAIGRYEVTVDEYTAFTGATGRTPTMNCITWSTTASKWGQVAEANWKSPGFEQTGRFPVGCVTIEDARAYAAWLAKKTGKPYRIPSEAEWEYAARAGTRTMLPWADTQEGICARANVSDRARIEAHGPGQRDPTRFFDCQDGFVYAAPVGSYAPDPRGLYDMIGNLWEWTEDCYIPNYLGAPADGSVWRDPTRCKETIVRGGGWYSRTWFARPAGRSRETPDYRSSTLGIRVVRDL